MRHDKNVDNRVAVIAYHDACKIERHKRRLDSALEIEPQGVSFAFFSKRSWLEEIGK
jgi:hypothetical protein